MKRSDSRFSANIIINRRILDIVYSISDYKVMNHRHLKISELTRLLNTTAKALRLYEKKELITPLRTDSGHRLYCGNSVADAALIVELRSIGFSIGKIYGLVPQKTFRDLDRLLGALYDQELNLINDLRGIRSKILTVRELQRQFSRCREKANLLPGGKT